MEQNVNREEFVEVFCNAFRRLQRAKMGYACCNVPICYACCMPNQEEETCPIIYFVYRVYIAKNSSNILCFCLMLEKTLALLEQLQYLISAFLKHRI